MLEMSSGGVSIFICMIQSSFELATGSHQSLDLKHAWGDPLLYSSIQHQIHWSIKDQRMHNSLIAFQHDGITLFAGTSLMLHSMETCHSHSCILNGLSISVIGCPALQVMHYLFVDMVTCWELTVWEIALIAFSGFWISVVDRKVWVWGRFTVVAISQAMKL